MAANIAASSSASTTASTHCGTHHAHHRFNHIFLRTAGTASTAATHHLREHFVHALRFVVAIQLGEHRLPARLTDGVLDLGNRFDGVEPHSCRPS